MSSGSHVQDLCIAPAGERQRVLAIIAASSGNLVEWFDFYVYAFCAIYFAPAFFPASDPTNQLLNTAGVFAAGFLMRPIGGWLFGRMADRKGRKAGLMVSVMMMCAGSLMIAVLPTYAVIGGWAPILLLLARLIQGLSVGGEYGTTATYMSEVASSGRRGFYSSFQYVTLIGGQLLASLVVVVLQMMLTLEQLMAWGWRIPFALGAGSAIVALLLRSTLHETAGDAERSHDDAGSVKMLLRQYPRPFLMVLGYTAGGSLIFYTFTTYMQKYLINSAGLPIATANAVMTACLLLFMCAQPIFGALSDRIGRRANMLIFSALGTITTLPFALGLGARPSAFLAFVLVASALIVISFYTSIAGIVKAEMFPTEVRALGVGLSYAAGNSLFGGTAEFVALKFKAAGYEMVFFVYVTAMMLLVFVISLRLPREARYLHRETVRS